MQQFWVVGILNSILLLFIILSTEDVIKLSREAFFFVMTALCVGFIFYSSPI